MGTKTVKNLRLSGILRNMTEKSNSSKPGLYIMESNGYFGR